MVTHICKRSKWSSKSKRPFENESSHYPDVSKVKVSKDYSNIMTGCILLGIAEGLFIVVLEDASGGHTHTIGINRGLNFIYDCIEKHDLQLSYENISK